VPLAVLAVVSSRYAIRPVEPFILFGGFFVASVLLGRLCRTVPMMWQAIVCRWFSQK